MSILVSLIEAGKVDDLKAIVVLAREGIIKNDVDTAKLILETVNSLISGETPGKTPNFVGYEIITRNS